MVGRLRNESLARDGKSGVGEWDCVAGMSRNESWVWCSKLGMGVQDRTMGRSRNIALWHSAARLERILVMWGDSHARRKGCALATKGYTLKMS